jgi:hypothetical protein
MFVCTAGEGARAWGRERGRERGVESGGESVGSREGEWGVESGRGSESGGESGRGSESGGESGRRRSRAGEGSRAGRERERVESGLATMCARRSGGRVTAGYGAERVRERGRWYCEYGVNVSWWGERRGGGAVADSFLPCHVVPVRHGPGPPTVRVSPLSGSPPLFGSPRFLRRAWQTSPGTAAASASCQTSAETLVFGASSHASTRGGGS